MVNNEQPASIPLLFLHTNNSCCYNTELYSVSHQKSRSIQIYALRTYNDRINIREYNNMFQLTWSDHSSIRSLVPWLFKRHRDYYGLKMVTAYCTTWVKWILISFGKIHSPIGLHISGKAHVYMTRQCWGVSRKNGYRYQNYWVTRSWKNCTTFG